MKCPPALPPLVRRVRRIASRAVRPAVVALVLCCVVSCGGRRTRADALSAAAPEPAVFRSVRPPAGCSGEERAAYMRTHYWDRFDFADTLFLSRADTLEMLRAFAAYVAQYVRPDDPAPIDMLMRRASASRPMFEYFWMLAERVLRDPNSPLRSDELYIPVLRAALASPWLDRWERIRPEHELRLALRNRVGQPASDFRYRLASGAEGTLYGIRAEYTLLYFANPDCPMCRRLSGELLASPLLNELTERGTLCVLAVYPDADLSAWRTRRDGMPAAWIDACDPRGVILGGELYDLRAIPSLYLLDREKCVLVKDSASVPEIERAIARRS